MGGNKLVNDLIKQSNQSYKFAAKDPTKYIIVVDGNQELYTVGSRNYALKALGLNKSQIRVAKDLHRMVTASKTGHIVFRCFDHLNNSIKLNKKTGKQELSEDVGIQVEFTDPEKEDSVAYAIYVSQQLMTANQN